MTASVRAYDTEVQTSNSTSITLTKPAGTVSGDLLLIWVATDGIIAHTGPAGWTDETVNLEEGTQISGRLFSKIAGGSEPADYTVTKDITERSAGLILAIQDNGGVDVVAGDTGPTAASATCPTVTTTVDDTLLFRLAAGDQGDATTPHTTESGYTMTGNVGGASSASVSGQYKTQASAGASGTQTVGMSASQEWLAATIAIKPAAAVTGNPWYAYAQQ